MNGQQWRPYVYVYKKIITENWSLAHSHKPGLHKPNVIGIEQSGSAHVYLLGFKAVKQSGSCGNLPSSLMVEETQGIHLDRTMDLQ